MKRILLPIYALLISTGLCAQGSVTLSTPQSAGQSITACQSIVLNGTFSFKAAAENSMSLTVNPSTCDPYAGQAASLPSNQNYIYTRTYTVADGSRAMDAIRYFDGLGRPVQTVQRGITPNAEDLVALQEYDPFGRESNVWLPGKSTANGAYADPASVKANAATLNSDTKPYSTPVYEASPLNRVLEQYSPGSDWHKAYQGDAKAVRTEYLTNNGTSGVLACKLYKGSGVSTDLNLTLSGYYANGELYVTKITDEGGSSAYEFKDKLGQVVLTRQINGSEQLDTYFVYDEFGNLCYVLSPLVADIGTTTLNSDNMKHYAYSYKYDNRNRCIWKKLPGCEPVYYVYDKADRLIFTQDGEQRANGKKDWSYNKYDALGRVIITGILAINKTNDELITACRDIVVKEEWKTTEPWGYTWSMLTAYITRDGGVLQVNYYDDYGRMLPRHGEPLITELGYTTESGYDSYYYNATLKGNSGKGLLLGTRTRYTNGTGAVGGEIITTFYYDAKGRVVQSKSTNHMGGYDKEYFAYNFTGQPIQKKHVHSASGKTTQTEVYAYTYDHAGRLLKTTHQLNSGATTILAENSYDDLGRLQTSRKANNTNLNTTYAYNVRSWTKSISSPLFSQTLYYNDQYAGSAKQYNGNIGAMQWTVQGDKTRGYAFTYDPLSRLTAANYLEAGTTSDSYKTGYSYDKHGNMKTLSRWGKTALGGTEGKEVDKLTINYTGNQVKNVKDEGINVAITESADFKKNTAFQDTEYTFNANGAMTKDLNKGISEIQYNSLNLPRRLVVSNSADKGSVEYTYTAGGAKLKTVHVIEPVTQMAPMAAATAFGVSTPNTRTTDYVGNIIYEDGALKRILIDGGYIEGGQYYFYLTDHLGNNRVVANASGTAIQKNHYYPFGMAFAETSADEQKKQPYKYNRKELDQELGLNTYDYSARYFDPALPRFTTVDPLAEKYYSISPYAYVANNPINAVDIRGDSITFTAENKDLLKQTATLINGGVGTSVAKIGKNGLLSVKTLNEKQLSKLTNEQKEFYNIIKDVANSEGMTNIGVVSGSEDVLIGSWDLSQIDVSDMNDIGEGEAMNKYSTFTHEIVEQQYKQTDSSPMYSIGHFIKAIPAEEKVSGYMRGREFPGEQGVIVFPYTRVGKGTINVHLTLNKGHITNVQRIKK